MKYDLLISDGDVVDPGSGLRGRLDVGIGLFHFKDYFDSPVSSLGESFGASRISCSSTRTCWRA